MQRDIEALTQKLNKLAGQLDAIADLAIDCMVDIRNESRELQEASAPLTLEEMLGRHTVPVIIDALLVLGGHKPALIRTGLNVALEVKSGRRGRSNGRDRVVPVNGRGSNGHHAELSA